MKKPAAQKRYDPTSRVMSLSFDRNPAEHAGMLVASAEKLLTARGPAFSRPMVAVLVAGGLGVGILMELYRRYVLALLTDLASIPTLGLAVLQLLPLLALAGLGIYVHLSRRRRRIEAALAARLDAKSFVDVDIFADGIRWTSGNVTIQVDWNAVRQIGASGGRIELATDTFSLYLPQRAFHNPADFSDGLRQLRGLWRNAGAAND
jgi:hypothetical protein